jgi:iron complex outermembrane recepter protein
MKLKLIAILTGYLLTINISTAQIKISGHIKDEQNQEDLIGAHIYINDLKTGVSTDNKGNFSFNNIKSGDYLIEFSFIGYKSKIEHLNITKDTNFNISLSESAKELNEVVITGVTHSTELKQSPIIIKTIDKNALNQNIATNLIDGLKNIPGVNQITTGASISKPIIRGLGYNRVISLHNGIRQEGQQWGDEHGIEIDEYAIDRIEIVKGPGSLMYGSDGIAGVLNFISPKAPNLGEVKTQVVTNYQSNNQLIGYSISNAGNKNGLQWLGRFSNKYASNYQNKYDGKIYNSGFKEYDGSAFLGINRSWGHAHLHLSSFNNIINLAEGERDSSGRFIFLDKTGNEVIATSKELNTYSVGFPHQSVQHFKVISNNYFILKKGTLHLDIGFQNNKRKEYGDVMQPNDIALYFDLSTVNYNVRYNLAEKNGWETAIGIGGMQQQHKNKGLEYLIPNYQLFDFGGFLFTQKTFFKKLTFAGGLRLDNRKMWVTTLRLDSLEKQSSIIDSTTKVKFNGFSNNYYGISGSIGASFQINATSTLKLNISRGFRAPNISELSSNGRHEGTFRYEIGTPRLKSEISHQIDLAYFLNSDHTTFELTPFVNFISNYIYARKLKNTLGMDSIPDMNDPAPAYQFTSGNAVLLGGEVYLDFHPHPFDWLHIENSFAYVQATQKNETDSTCYLPFIPAPKYRGEIKTEFKKAGKVLSNVYAKIAMDYFFQQNQYFKAYGTETKTPDYTLWSIGIGCNIKAFHKNDFLNVYISGENLLDAAYQSHLSRLKYASKNIATDRNGVFNMGRNISLKLVFNI